MKRAIQKLLNAKVTKREDLNVESKFVGLMGGYQSLNEHSYLLLVDLSKDNAKR